MKELETFLIGIALTLVGFVVLLSNINVSAGWFYHYGNINVGAILLILVAISFVYVCLKGNLFSIILFIMSMILFVVSVLLTVRMSMYGISAFEIFAIAICFFGGIGCIIKSTFKTDKTDNK